jgi:hypothetical protein
MINFDQELNTKLFEDALIQNRPAFVDYFLRKKYDVLQTTEFIQLKNNPNEKTIRTIITKLNTTLAMLKTNNNQTKGLSNQKQISTTDDENKHQPEPDNPRVRAVYARKFIIKKLYKKEIDHLKVIIYSH